MGKHGVQKESTIDVLLNWAQPLQFEIELFFSSS